VIVYAGVDYEAILREAEKKWISSCGTAEITISRSMSLIY
jgi:predicted GTPase